MKMKDFGLLIALGVLAFMAVFSEKKILVAEGYAFTREELTQGRSVYQTFCRKCHDKGRRRAPRIGYVADWDFRLEQDLQVLISHAINGFRGKQGWMPPRGGADSLSNEEVGLAVAFMVQQVPEAK